MMFVMSCRLSCGLATRLFGRGAVAGE